MDNQPVQPTPQPSLQTPVSSPETPINPKHAHRFIFGYLALIIIVAALGGMYAWQHNKVTKSDTKAANLQSQISTLKSQVNKLSKQALAASSASSNTQYLQIPEEGIEFKLSSDISDAYYVKTNGYIYLSVHRFDNDGGLSGCSAEGGNQGVVSLIVAQPGQPNGDFAGDDWTLASIKQAGLTQVGNSYYGFQQGNGICYNPTAADSSGDAAQYSAVEQAFMAAVLTITKL